MHYKFERSQKLLLQSVNLCANRANDINSNDVKTWSSALTKCENIEMSYFELAFLQATYNIEHM